MFQELEFKEACEELDTPNVADWELFVESHGVKIYRLYREDTGLYQYKVFGTLNDVLPETCAKVHMDLEYRKTWDNYVKELHEIDENGKKGVYWRVKFPFPLSNRDYTFVRDMREFDVSGRHIWVALYRSEAFDTVPEVSGVVRVSDFCESLVITTDGSTGTKAFMKYFDNPGGMIPTWLINWAAKTGVPSFLDIMQKSCRNYPKYLQSLHGNA